jgi:hypothetical protein
MPIKVEPAAWIDGRTAYLSIPGTQELILDFDKTSIKVERNSRSAMGRRAVRVSDPSRNGEYRSREVFMKFALIKI